MGKKNPFNTVSENLPFYPDQKDESEKIHEPFIGLYVSSSILGDSPDITKQIPVYVFSKLETGEKYYVVQSYAIKKAVETAKAALGSLVDCVFQFVFKEKTEVNGKPFNVFTTGYCTLEQYNLSLLADEKPEAKTKKK
jgi:hypothetical protein